MENQINMQADIDAFKFDISVIVQTDGTEVHQVKLSDELTFALALPQNKMAIGNLETGEMLQLSREAGATLVFVLLAAMNGKFVRQEPATVTPIKKD